MAQGKRSRSRSRSGVRTVRRPARVTGRLYRSRSRSAAPSRSQSRGRSRSRDVRRRRPPSRSFSRPRTVNRPSGGEYSRLKFRVGSVQRAPAWKQLSKLCLTRRILRFQGVNPLNRGEVDFPVGKYDCGAVFIGNSVENEYACKLPVYVFNLTGTINANISSDVAHRLGFTSGGVFAWEPITGSIDVGGTTTSWGVEWASDAAVASEHHRYIEQKYYDIRLMLRNATAQPTVWTIQVVSFEDEHLDPYNIISSVNGSYGTSYQQADAKAFWTGIAKADVSNPILPSTANRVTLRRMHVWKNIRVTMEPDMETDMDKFPKTKDVRIMFNDNRVLDYQEYSPVPNNQLLFRTDAWTTFNQGTFRTNPAARARRYLIVRAMDPTVSSLGSHHPSTVDVDTTLDSKNTPSFDIVIRKKEVVRPH